MLVSSVVAYLAVKMYLYPLTRKASETTKLPIAISRIDTIVFEENMVMDNSERTCLGFHKEVGCSFFSELTKSSKRGIFFGTRETLLTYDVPPN